MSEGQMREPSRAEVYGLVQRLAEDEEEAKALALWRLVQEEVDAEVERRLACLTATAVNDVKAVVSASMGSLVCNTVRLLVVMKVNGTEYRAVCETTEQALASGDRHVIMRSLRDDLGRQIADEVLSGLDFPRWR